ncbi:hypothetical protein F7731_09425 [Cytobacillus depressus]|uniref:Uncharacterized protein n=1 Tax=Cytobacillus depressus TaxID=1602942 RepID=A0A6L3V5Y0_9BACI|nr:hypothetical protein F7731_09425 [Cytobacillus depressus]
MNTPWDFFKVGYDISNILGYYGAVLTFLGTVSLGIITVYQNYVSHQKTDEINKLTLELQKKSMAMAEQRYEKEKLDEIKKNTPKFELKNSSSNGNYMNLRAELKNVSDFIVSGIKSISFEVFDETNAIVTTSHKAQSKETSLSPGDSAIIEFHNDQLRSKTSKVESGSNIPDTLKNLTIIWSFQCEDQFGNTHYLKAKLDIEDSKNFVGHPWEVQKVG